MNRRDLLNPLIVLIVGSGVLTAAGCGGSPPPPPAQTENTATTPQTSTAPSEEPVALERKWIGTIPYDVFYDQPLTIAADQTKLETAAETVAATPSDPPVSTTPATTTSAPSAAPTPTVVDWKVLMPMPMLVEEVKLLRTRLTGNLQTVATFNRGTSAISLDAAVLTALVAIAAQHPDEVSWKEKAPYIRDLAHELSIKGSGSGREAFQQAKEPFEKLTTLLDGGPVPPEPAAASVPYGEAVDRSDMMKRIEISFNSVKANVNTAPRLKEKAAEAERELRLLSAFGTLMTDHSYDAAEEEAYRKYAQRFTTGAVDAADAAKADNFTQFEAALNHMQNACAECHQQYRGGESGFGR